ncbi:hypothetical protein BJP34_35755 (plasmid) [Moorena producens PAL-8-15-08-1]|uniref:Uncharacterized protein n=1 Tax=Moorena producens PAL-8-15-08-1 TaxID=1458985 RepID=A0A1D8U4A0_9CYAN|nr:hypothetical protein [Moorena producens]AOX04737.1 hypothetical protein BJP34_35755 [Moorena producens PAL-8-15-08-1]
MLPSHNFGIQNPESHQLLSTSTPVPNSENTGFPVAPLVRGSTSVALVIALTFFTKTVIEAITKLVKEIDN